MLLKLYKAENIDDCYEPVSKKLRSKRPEEEKEALEEEMETPEEEVETPEEETEMPKQVETCFFQKEACKALCVIPKSVMEQNTAVKVALKLVVPSFSFGAAKCILGRR